MAEDATRIKTFARKIQLAALGSALPTIADPMVWASPWESVGLFDQEVTIEFTEERIRFKPHGKIADTKVAVIRKGVSFGISVGETDIHHLKRALSSAVESAGTLKDGGVSTINELGWAIETPNGVWHFKQGAGDGNLSLAIPDDEFSKMTLNVVMTARASEADDEELWIFHDFLALGV